MIGLGSAIGAALSLGPSIYGGIQASKAAKKAKENNEKQQQENQNWYDRRYNEDATQRADAQRILTMTADNIRKRNRAAAGAAAVGGATTESIAAEKAANNEALADATSRIAAAADARKDDIENQYMATKNALVNQDSQIEQQRAQNIATATNAAGNAVANAGLTYDQMNMANKQADADRKMYESIFDIAKSAK